MSDACRKRKQHNDQSITEFVGWVICFSVLVRSYLFVLYNGVFYFPFSNKSFSFRQSIFSYCAMVAVDLFVSIVVLGIERNMWSSIKCTAIPASISLVVFYCRTYVAIVIAVVAMVTVGIIFYISKYIYKCRQAVRIHKRLRKEKVIFRMLRNAFSYIGCVAFLTVAVFIGASFIIPEFGYRSEKGSIRAASYEVRDDSFMALLDQHKDELMVLQDRYFSETTKMERLDALQTLLNCETTYWGIEPVTLKAKSMEDYKGGYYESKDRIVYISYDVIMGTDNSECIETVLHEGRHFYQYSMIQYAIDNNLDISQPIYADIREWKENTNNYCEFSGNESDVLSYLTYKSQPIERDAYSYSNNVGMLVMSHINGW